jgi:hypothetical protein
MKKNAATLAFIVVLLVTTASGAFPVRLGNANPYLNHEWVSPPAGSTPLAISIFSPNNNTTYRTNDITLAFKITTQNTSIHYLLGAYYKASWMPENVTVYKQNTHSPEFPTSWSYNNTFRQMPDGEYSINITTWGDGGYPSEGLTYNFFEMTTIAVVTFVVDTVAPAISIVSIENKTYYESELPLEFAVNETVSKISYVLDGLENVTVVGNSTLFDLPVGLHNVTFYACDAAGNVGASETVVFIVAEPAIFPTVPVVAASTATTGLAAGLLVYFKKRKHHTAH